MKNFVRIPRNKTTDLLITAYEKVIDIDVIDKNNQLLNSVKIPASKQHPHAALMIAYALDSTLVIECSDPAFVNKQWFVTTCPGFEKDMDYRIKPTVSTK